jgi:hypothetical protein
MMLLCPFCVGSAFRFVRLVRLLISFFHMFTHSNFPFYFCRDRMGWLTSFGPFPCAVFLLLRFVLFYFTVFGSCDFLFSCMNIICATFTGIGQGRLCGKGEQGCLFSITKRCCDEKELQTNQKLKRPGVYFVLFLSCMQLCVIYRHSSMYGKQNHLRGFARDGKVFLISFTSDCEQHA